jgi:hypothetical protein
MATPGTSRSIEPDMALISELMEEISRNSPAIAAQKLLVEHYIAVGWFDAAEDNIMELCNASSRDADITRLAKMLASRLETDAKEQAASKQTTTTFSKQVKKKTRQAPPLADIDIITAGKELKEGYSSLRVRAHNVLSNLKHLAKLQKQNGLPQSQNIARIQAIVDGQKAAPTHTGPPASVRTIARTIIASDSSKAMDLVIADLEHTVQYWRASGADDEKVRVALVKRIESLETALPNNLKIYCDLGLMHVVHENLEKSYVNDETMLGDSVKDVPREDFYVTEDNYFWAMSELVQAITVNGGVMRNPLNKHMFTPKDIRGILVHPLGKPLHAIRIKQNEMSRGVRPDTITHMEKLGMILLEDNSSDQLASRHAIDEFTAYIATCKYTITFTVRGLCLLILEQCQRQNRKPSKALNVRPETLTLGSPTTSPSARRYAMLRETGSVFTRPEILSSRRRRICVRTRALRRGLMAIVPSCDCGRGSGGT